MDKLQKVNKSDYKIERLMSKEDALKLTQDIQSTTSALYVLIKRAHDEKAWLSLGYNSWSSYIEEEFNFSRTRSYQLINQANVIERIEEASGMPLYITEREARDIKKRLPEITQKLEDEVKGSDISPEEAKEKIMEAVRPEYDGENIDNAKRFDESDREGFYNEKQDGEADEGWEPPEVAPPAKKGFKTIPLSDEDKFYYDNLLITLQIFESMPDAVAFGQTIEKSNENKKELVRLAEYAFAWITQMLDEVE